MLAQWIQKKPPSQATAKESSQLFFSKIKRNLRTFDQKNKISNEDLNITDPYDCKEQSLSGNVVYSGDKNNLNSVILKVKNFNANQTSYDFQTSLNDYGDYQIDIKKVQIGN